jgi:hypothetical protein
VNAIATSLGGRLQLLEHAGGGLIARVSLLAFPRVKAA